MNKQDDAEQHLTKLLVHLGDAKQILLLAAGLLVGWILIVNIAVFTDPNSAFRAGQDLGFWDLVLSITQRMGFWLLSACVLVMAWAMLTMGQLYVAISALSDEDPDEPGTGSPTIPPPPGGAQVNDR